MGRYKCHRLTKALRKYRYCEKCGLGDSSTEANAPLALSVAKMWKDLSKGDEFRV